ncbi:asparagine synthase-related protein [Natrinema sp. 74]|uniref:asparagine synthase-related protein n=1 Tax=Natrinema sp. 74 TaxID=3384159 RepID=UPI0038D483CB
MVELIGDSTGKSPVFSSKERFQYESWYEYDESHTDTFQLGFYHHGDRDPGDWSVVSTDWIEGMVYGYILHPNSDASLEGILEAVVEKPDETLALLSGSFALAVATDDELIIASDKIGSRPIYYTPHREGAFSTHPGALVPALDDPSVNTRAISEMLQTGFSWGEKTLVCGINCLPVSSYLRWSDHTLETKRYWQFNATVSDANYVSDVYNTFTSATSDAVETVPDEARVGTYLSGGLDSRLLSGVLAEYESDLTSYTYDANPGGGVNLELARQLADRIGIDNTSLEYDPQSTAKFMEEAIRRTSGLQSWHEFHGISGKLKQFSDELDVVFWGAGQGELFGEDIPHDICCGNPIKKLSSYWSSDISDQILTDAPDIRDTIATEYRKSEHDTEYARSTDLILRNYYSNGHARGNIERTVAGFRCIHADTRVIEKSTPVPPAYRWGPVAEYGRIFSHSMSKLKLELVRRHASGIEQVSYERTGFPPKRSVYLHDMAEKYKKGIKKSSQSLQGKWYRESSILQDTVDPYLNDVMYREFINADAVSDLRTEHLSSTKDHIDPLAKLSTIEIWLQEYVD